MKGAIAMIAAAGFLSACATTPPATTTAALTASRADYSHWSCRQIGAELALTERAVVSAAKRDRSPRENQTAQAFLFPASLGAAPPAAGEKLEARLADLRRASRAKRCTSAWAQDTATA